MGGVGGHIRCKDNTLFPRNPSVCGRVLLYLSKLNYVSMKHKFLWVVSSLALIACTPEKQQETEDYTQ